MSIFPHICNILSNYLIKVEKNYTFPLEMTQKNAIFVDLYYICKQNRIKCIMIKQ